MQTSHQYFIGLGSNRNFNGKTPFELLNSALLTLHEHKSISLKFFSSCYISQPHGPQDQDVFHNAAAEINSYLEPEALLIALQKIESQYGLNRQAKTHWGPRTLDLDILLFNSEIVDLEHLQIPHPYLEKREFVLLPLAELADKQTKGIILPNGKKIKSLAEKCAHNGIIKLSEKFSIGL